jgi:hypothetical protein
MAMKTPVPKLEGAAYAHCRMCVVEVVRPDIEVLVNRDCVQVWCRNHNVNVAVFHIHAEMPKQVTVVNDVAGKLLAVLPDILEQVRVGRDFYVGQKRHVVLNTHQRTPDELVITVKEP